MWKSLVLFEIRYWLRSWLLWIFLLLTAVMALWCSSSNTISVGVANCDWNAGYVIEEYYSIFALFTLLMATVFVNSSATRDFACHTDQIVFATPIRKRDYLAGRFLGATLVSTIPMLGVSLGILLAPFAPWSEGAYQHVRWSAHALGILLFALPNALFIAAILFAVAVLARSAAASFISGICILTGYSISRGYLSDLKSERVGALLDPFGTSTFRVMTQYWTTADKNRLLLGFHGLMLWNRLLWIAAGLSIFVFAYRMFRFAPRMGHPHMEMETLPVLGTPAAAANDSAPHAWAQFASMLKIEWRALTRTVSFFVMLACGLAIMLTQLIGKATEGYGATAFPVTYKVVELIQAGLFLFGVAVVLYFAGVVVWRERDSGADEILDAIPVPEWLCYLAKLCAVVIPLLLFQCAGVLAGVAVQAAHGYYRFQLGVYLAQILGMDFLSLVFLAMAAIFSQVAAPHKYAAWFGFPAFLTLDEFIWKPLNIGTHMVVFGDLPDVTYSDFFGWAPYRGGLIWFTLYWAGFCVLLAALTTALWRRGRETRWRHRIAMARMRLHGPLARAAWAALLLYAIPLAMVVYNTEILHRIRTERDTARDNARYEKLYKQYEHAPQPSVVSARYFVDLRPESRAMTVRCEEIIRNQTRQPIDRLYLDFPAQDRPRIDLPKSKLLRADPDRGFRIFQFTPPLQPGESRLLTLEVHRQARGFENGAGDLSVVSNGSFFNNWIAPRIGYQRESEVIDDRQKYGLGDRVELPEPTRQCTADCAHNYLEGSADWMDVEAVISTGPGQIAIAPGSLLGEWQANGRRYFRYRLDHPSLNFFSFQSADYEISREQWNGIQIEVYHLKEHPWNIPRMRGAIRKSLDYYIHNFGPYFQREARIIEFPRIMSFAQAYPGTMPYSEAVGFIANLQDPDDIDHVFYVVAHEMAHQWWAHQVVGARVQGATLLSESLAQYSALMVMEKEYGQEMIRKFLRYEIDGYLKGRAAEKRKERPLLFVRDEQGYVRYQKASAVFYQMRQMIGEDAMNRALRRVLAKYRYALPPYPTSYDLVDAIRSETPPEMQYLIKDLFEDITLYRNSVTAATAWRQPDGTYQVRIDLELSKFKQDANGHTSAVPFNDRIDVGVFAAPKHGKYGKLLYMQRSHIRGNKVSFVIPVTEKPATAAVDPLGYFIDLQPDNNQKAVEFK